MENNFYDHHEPVRIRFRVFEDGDVIALFEDEEWTPGEIASYQIVGQHGGASPELVDDLRTATDAEKAALSLELNRIGYRVIDADNE